MDREIVFNFLRGLLIVLGGIAIGAAVVFLVWNV